MITSTRLLATILSLSRICTVSAINILGKRYLVHISQKSRVGLGHAYIDYLDPYTQYNFFMFSVSICLCLHSFDMCCRILLSHMHRLESILRLSQVLLNLIAASFRNYFTFFFSIDRKYPQDELSVTATSARTYHGRSQGITPSSSALAIDPK